MEGGIASLQAKYEDCLAKKDELDKKYQLCEARLIRADKVRGREKIRQHFMGPHGDRLETERWPEQDTVTWKLQIINKSMLN